jgi:hypothetical protein
MLAIAAALVEHRSLTGDKIGSIIVRRRKSHPKAALNLNLLTVDHAKRNAGFDFRRYAMKPTSANMLRLLDRAFAPAVTLDDGRLEILAPKLRNLEVYFARNRAAASGFR